ncbi:MAG: hypothetical protein AAFX03_11845 [Pseudomonadota bacterium]
MAGRISSAPTGEAGFSVLEVVVAVALLGAAMLPLMALQMQTSGGAAALERTLDRRLAEQVARDYLKTINLAAAPTGQGEIGGGWRLAWRAAPARGPDSAVYSLGLDGRYSMTLYDAECELTHEDGRRATFAVRGVSARATRPYVTF